MAEGDSGTTDTSVSEHPGNSVLFARSALIASTALLVLAPMLGRFGWDVEHVLLLCGGLTNLVAVGDIARQPKLADGERRIRVVLTSQLLLLALIIGSDMARVSPSDSVRLVLSLSIVIITLFWAALTARSVNARLAALIFGLILSLAINTNAELLGLLSSSLSLEQFPSWVQHIMGGSTIRFCQERITAWFHLVAIPAIYLFGDLLLRKSIPASARGLALDRQLLLIGSACSIAGIAASNHLFEAGSSAVVLLLGNWVYISYVHVEAKTGVSQTGSPPGPGPAMLHA